MATSFDDLDYLESVYAALFAHVQTAVFAAGITLQTSTRDVVIPDNPLTRYPDQPALVQFNGPAHVEQTKFNLPKWTITALVAIYFRADAAVIKDPLPATMANRLVWGIKKIFDTTPPYEKQTLGGLVYHAWIEGEVAMEVQDNQAVITIPIWMLAGDVGSTAAG